MHASIIASTWEKVKRRFAKTGVQPSIYVLDNEASQDLKNQMEEKDIISNWFSPHIHCTNLVERALQAFKNNFKAGLSSLDPGSSLSEQGRLISQVELILNLLSTARLNPKLSSWATIFGEYNFNATFIAPLVTHIIAHTKPSIRLSWAPNGEKG